MIADPQSITIDTVTHSLPRILTGTREGLFRNASVGISVETNAKNGRVRTVARFDETKVTTDPLVSTTNVIVNDSIALTINRPVSGFTDDMVLKQVTGFITWLTAGTNANLKKIIAGEN